jgi:hypothetical protein
MGRGSAGWLLTPSWNDSFAAVTQVLQAGGKVYRLTAPAKPWAPGTFWIPAEGPTTAAMIAKLASDYGLPFQASASAPGGGEYALKPLRVGLYHRFRGGSMDEGWTRWIFDNWKMPYTRIDGSDVQAGGLGAKFDVVIIPDDSVKALMGPTSSKEPYPPEYDKSLGDKGVAALKDFADAGGTVVFLAGASDLAIEKFGIPVKDAVGGMPMKQFYAPGSMLKVKFDTAEPLAYGMPSDGMVLYDSAPAFEMTGSGMPIDSAAAYPASGLLQSGWLIGENYIAGKSALLDVGYGKGRLVLVGFGPQNRAETHGTFKVLFNAIYLPGSAAPAGK